MQLGSNKKGIQALLVLVCAVVVIFFLEKKFLVRELRGETLSQYQKIKWIAKVLMLLDDFEGLKKDSASIAHEGFFSFGSGKIALDTMQNDGNPLASKTSMKLQWNKTTEYGGWGKGVGRNFDINTLTDYLNFRVYVPKSNGDNETIKIILEEDDNSNGILEKEKDDSWFFKLNVAAKDEWQFISIPLKDFLDDNAGGDNLLNITRKGGLHTIVFSFEQTEKFTTDHKWYFDFVCFTNGKVQEGK